MKLAAGGFFAGITWRKPIYVLLFAIGFAAMFGNVGALTAMHEAPYLDNISLQDILHERITVCFYTATAIISLSETTFTAGEVRSGILFYSLCISSILFTLSKYTPCHIEFVSADKPLASYSRTYPTVFTTFTKVKAKHH